MQLRTLEHTDPAMQRRMAADVDVQALEAELRRRVEGEVRFDPGTKADYATDASNYSQTPIGVVIPRSVEDVVQTVAVCREHGAPILSRGGGTSLSGQCCNVAVVIDFSKYLNRVLEIDPERRVARVQPGVILDDLRHETEKYGLTYGPDPSTHDYCVLGGMIGNDACGVHSRLAEVKGTGPRTADNVEELEILTHEGLRMRVGRTSDEELEGIIREGGRRGEIYSELKQLRDAYADQVRERFPDIPRRVSGYNLDELLPEKGFDVARALVGTEGTCCVVLEATVKLVESPPERTMVALGYDDVYQAGDDVARILQYEPIGLEGMDDLLIDYMEKKHLHPGSAQLLPEGGGGSLWSSGRKVMRRRISRRVA